MDITQQKKRMINMAMESVCEPCHDLQLYLLHPQSVLSLAEFEELALERLKALRIIENSFIREASKSFEERRALILSEFKKQNLRLYAKLLMSSGCNEGSEADKRARMDDHNAHFILRIAYCRSDALRKWLVARESEFFKLRFLSLSSRGVRSFLNAYTISYTAITDEEKNSLKEMLVTSTATGSYAMVESTDFYKVQFTDVTDLVSSRKVFLSNGFAYVPSTDLVSVVTAIFKKTLTNGLNVLANDLLYLEEDERINDFLSGLHSMHTGETYSVARDPGCVKPEDLDGMSQTSFPLCMRQVHDSIRANNHSKHGGRMQYGLFLKAVGLSVEDSLRFWREAFSKKVDADQFEKKYAYTINHNYGQKGKRVSYSPYSCMKIIQSPVGFGDCHGCPFRHSDANSLKQKLQGFGIPVHGLDDIMDLVSQNHYQIACTKYFELVHNTDAPEVVNHPNQYFEMSQEILTGKPASGRVKAETFSNGAARQTTNSSRGADAEIQTSKEPAIEKVKEEMDEIDVDMSDMMMEMDQ